MPQRALFTPTASFLLVGMLFFIVTIAYFFFLPPEIPLFYTLARTQDFIVKSQYIFIFPLFAGGVAFFQSQIARRIRGQEFLLSILNIATLLTIVLVYIACIRIVVVVG
ncbi:MAG TPA: hypothetical protein DCX25_02840 [Candidatus Pacebacteria bacterium]|nr:MAG: hypothetical protein UX00_C0004G0009 [Microgenomates group bacterium GW2011_GWB1_45_17]KKU23993.1 MAG: hypothetical protein UX35_C0003G0129 [Microgenomates group bacterium GW2011_GWA1_46_15]KKU24614.1 MAG: hypothetical protein UX36_C0001G0231 [Microgenomates group bacterium GW2011_GWC1_46_15]HAV15241.1 hypothetical protein [Candidatus Paceibacterota bacterium]HCR10956.1 hypothetical protein [Candidatus Paceibacterota bacterium]